VRKLNPEEEELDRQLVELAKLENQIGDRELELSTLQAQLEQFRSRYMSVVGRRYAELDRIEAKIAQLLALKNPDNADARQQAQFRREAAEESTREAGCFDNTTSNQGRFTPTGELKNLFRMIAKAMHPDLAADEADRANRSKAMTAANKAYREGDEEGLRRILANWDSSPDNVVGNDIASRLVRAIRSIHRVRQRLAAIAEETRQLRAGELFVLYEQCEKSNAQGQDLLADIASDINDRIEAAKNAERTLLEN